MVRALLEFGMLPWDSDLTVADHLFTEIEQNGLNELIDNQQLLKIVSVYKEWYDQGIEPNAKSFLYHQDVQLNMLAVSLMDTSNDEVSPNWQEKYERKVLTREDLYMEEVISCMNYLKLRKIKRLIAENQRDMEKTIDLEDQINLIETHQHLKQLEMQLVSLIGTVIVK